MNVLTPNICTDEAINFVERCDSHINNLAESKVKSRLEIQLKVIQRLNHQFEQWQKGGLDLEVNVHHVYWELLKPSGNSWKVIERRYENLQRANNKRYEIERIQKIHSLEPQDIYIGLASFEGYIVFVFQKYNCAVMDCPEVGNALYCMDTNKWKSLSQLSKTELLSGYREEVQRIIHGQNWFFELQNELQKRL